MAISDNNYASDGEKFNPAKDVYAGLVREVGSNAIWSLSSCKSGNVMMFFHTMNLINLSAINLFKDV
jgi:hypothetical protein